MGARTAWAGTKGRRAALVALTLAGCSARISGTGTAGHGPGGPPGATSPAPAFPFEALPPTVYGSKVKNLLTGQALTSDELGQLTAHPDQLRSLVETWMARPEWEARMLVFFEQAFQQTQISKGDFLAQYDRAQDGIFSADGKMDIARQFIEMFPRTVLELIREGRPFTEVVTTTRFMMTPPLMTLMANLDAVPKDDFGNINFGATYALDAYPNLPNWSVTEVDRPVPLNETLDPTSPNFMQWSAQSTNYRPDCTFPRAANSGFGAVYELQLLPFGVLGGQCGYFQSTFADADWSAWRMINVRQPRTPTEPKTLFWNVPQMFTLQELVLQTPRVGFMTTPAFFANYPTNTSNVARVTVNQTMIVALGVAFDDRGVVTPLMSSAGDQEHAKPGTTCYGCHQTLDPMRDFFRQTYTYGYGIRDSYAADAGIPDTAVFTALGSPPVSGHGIADLASAIIAHPRFPIAWAQKLCRFANSADCSEDDPEFQRIVQDFVHSNYNFKVLMAELFSSPLITFASETKTADDKGVIVSISRHDTLCSSLSNRLGLPDVCGIYGRPPDGIMANILHSVPGDGYARGAEAPLLPTRPNLFFQSATESACARLAAQLVDQSYPDGGTSRFRSAQSDAALQDMVATVLGVPAADKRSFVLHAFLAQHYADALKTGASATDALQSAFMLACSSPQAIASGL